MRFLGAFFLLAGCVAGCGGGPPESASADESVFRFEGMEYFGADALRERVARAEKRYREEPRATVLADAAFRIRQAYLLEGFYRVSVTFEEQDGRAAFRIDEGQRFDLGRVHFSGNRFISDDELKELKPGELLGTTLPYSERLIARVRADILRLYNEHGFVEADVGEGIPRVDEEEGRIHVTFEITEGRGYHLEREWGGGPYTSGTGREIEAAIVDHYRDAGRPFVRARVTPTLDWDYGEVALDLEVDPGAEARILDFVFEGNGRTRDSFVLRRAGLKQGEAYSASELRRAESRLQKTGLFHTARVEAAEFHEDRAAKDGNLTLKFRLEEADPGELSVSTGYSTFDGLRVGTDLKYKNLFGGAELVRVGGTVSQFGWRAEADAAVRFILGSDLTSGIGGFYEERDEPSYEATTYGGEYSVSYPFFDTVTVRTGVRFAEVDTEDVDPSVPAGDVLDFEYTALFVSASIDQRDNPYLPTKGFYVTGDVEWTDDPLTTDIEFIDANARGALFLPLPLGLVWATGLQGGQILPISDTDTIPVSLRYSAGGTGSVRGFEFRSLGPGGPDDPTGGEVYLAMQTEVRFPIWNVVHGAFFHDRGGVWFRHDAMNLDDTRWSVGSGLRIYTPAGALTADAAWNPSKRDGEDAVEFHFSIGFPF